MRAIRKHLVDVLAILGLVVVALAVASVILANQRLALPGWMPVIGQDFTEVDAELSSAQAVTPGQGQTVNVAGVQVGEISRVRLEGGKAIVTLKLEEGSVPVYKDASVLLRPKTGLKDMVAELTPGTPEAGALEEGRRIPIGQTLPDVNLDEILASLDGDTRTYLQLLLSDGGQALGDNGRALANTIRRFEPTARDTRAIAEQLATRRKNIRRVIHNFSLVVDEWAARTTSSPSSSTARTPCSRRWPTRTPTCARRSRSSRRRWPRRTPRSPRPRRSPTSWARRSRRCVPAPGRSARRSCRPGRSCARPHP